MKSYRNHKTVKLEVNGKEVDVDEGIVPAVKWLNSIPGVITEYSCQGDNTGRLGFGPHVMFRMAKNDLVTLAEISKKLESHTIYDGHLRFVAPNVYVPYLRFNIEWMTNNHLQYFYKRTGMAETKEIKLGPADLTIKAPKWTTPKPTTKKKKKKKPR